MRLVDIETVRPLVSIVSPRGFFEYEVFYVDETPPVIVKINPYGSHLMMDNQFHEAILKHWEDHNIPPTPRDVSND